MLGGYRILKKVTLRVKDIMLLIPSLFGIISGIFCILFFLIKINELIDNRLMIIGVISVIFISLWMVIYFAIYLRGFKIELKNNILYIRMWDNGLYPLSNFTIPMWIENNIHLQNIERVILAPIEYFNILAEETDDKILKQKLVLPKNPIDEKIKVLYIKEIKGSINIINATPYSKKQLYLLLEILVEESIEVFYAE